MVESRNGMNSSQEQVPVAARAVYQKHASELNRANCCHYESEPTPHRNIIPYPRFTLSLESLLPVYSPLVQLARAAARRGLFKLGDRSDKKLTVGQACGRRQWLELPTTRRVWQETLPTKTTCLPSSSLAVLC